MRRALLCALAACSSKSAAPGAGSGSSAIVGSGSAAVTQPAAPAKRPAPRPAAPIDLPEAGVSKLQVHPAIDPANQITVGWNALARNVTVACREDAFNLVWIDPHDPEGLPKGSHLTIWQPDPFVPAPQLCEVRFYDGKNRILARACWRDGALAPTHCPMPRVKMPEPPVLVNVEGASAHITGKTAEVQALVTLEAEAPGQHFGFALRCDGIAGKRIDDIDGRDDLAKLDAGDTVFMRMTFDLAKPVSASPRCQLDVSDPKPVSTFCIAEGSTEPGPCAK